MEERLSQQELLLFEELCAAVASDRCEIALRPSEGADDSFRDSSLGSASALAVMNDEPREVLVVALSEGIAVAPLRLRWFGAAVIAPKLASPLDVIPWHEIDVEQNAALDRLGSLVAAAAVRRQRTYRRCSECDQLTPPEYLHGGRPPICMGCAERNHGVVH